MYYIKNQLLNLIALVYLKRLVIIFLITLPLMATGEPNDQYYRLPLKIMAGNHVVGLPFQNLFSSTNPGFMLGSEVIYNKNVSHKFGQTLCAGIISNQVIGNTVTLHTDAFYRYGRDFHAEIGLGFGGLLQFRPRHLYKYRNDLGEWESVKDQGTFSLMPGINLAVGYDFSEKLNIPLNVAIKHRFFMQASYFDYQAFPAMPQSFSGIEITYKIRKNEK